jgi:sugar phosphate isomerase/epimerase
VQLALTPDGRWDFATPELVSAAATAGFTAVGINSERVDAAAVQAYASAGVTCHELLALVVTDDEAATVAAAEQLADAAQAISAPWALTVFTTPPSDTLIRQCAKVFGDAGAGMAVEFSPLGPIATIRDGLEVVRAARRGGQAALMIDSWHFSFGESTWEDLATVPLDDIAYVQFTDALEPESRERLVRETLHRRALPGQGVLELDRFAGILLGRGYDGVVSVEVLSAELRTQPVDVLTRRLYDTTAAYWLS